MLSKDSSSVTLARLEASLVEVPGFSRSMDRADRCPRRPAIVVVGVRLAKRQGESY
jgi:hypothetical protein